MVIAGLMSALMTMATLPMTAQASTPATSEAIAVVYGKFDTQIQFVICLNSTDPNAQSITFDTDTLAYSYEVLDPSSTVIATGSLPAAGVTYVSMPTCYYGYPEAFAVNDLTPGTTYTINTTATLTPKIGGTPEVFNDTLVVTTTGGCPLDAPVESPPAYSYLYALLNSDNVVTQVLSIAPGTVGLEPWASMGIWAPTYYGWPGKQYAGMGYIYDPVTDNFGPPVAPDTTVTETDLLTLANLDGCANNAAYNVDLTVDSASTDNCTVSGGDVVATADGVCEVGITVTDATRSLKQGKYRTLVPSTSSSAMLVVTGTPSGGGAGGGGGGGGGGSGAGGSSGGASGSTSTGAGGGALQEITSVQPASGPLVGGNQVAIVGYGFTGASDVTIGGKHATFTVVNDAHVDVAIPPGDAPGPVDVAVILSPERGRAFAPGGYVYTANPSNGPTSTPSTSPTGNPASTTSVIRGVVLLAQTDAANVPPRQMRKTAGSTLAAAPRITAQRGRPLALVVPGMTPGVTYMVKIKSAGAYRDLGTVTAFTDGTLALPVVTITRTGTWTVALVDTRNGRTAYIRVLVSPTQGN